MRSVDRAINSLVAPRLKALGFARRRNTWNRRRAFSVQVVAIQQSSNNHDREVRFTVNLGIRPGGAEAWVRATDCRPEPQRLGFVTPAREDKWYRCAPHDLADVDRTVRACLFDIETYGLPWLEAAPTAPTATTTGTAVRQAPRWLRWLSGRFAARAKTP